MNNIHKELENVLASLYDYEYIDLDKFYNYKENIELFEVLNDAIVRGYPVREEMENLQELKDNLDNFIKFETNYNSEIGDF